MVFVSPLSSGEGGEGSTYRASLAHGRQVSLLPEPDYHFDLRNALTYALSNAPSPLFLSPFTKETAT